MLKMCVSSALLYLFFTSNFAVFVHGDTKIFLGAGYPSYATANQYFFYLKVQICIAKRG